MSFNTVQTAKFRPTATVLLAAVWLLAIARGAHASTYVVEVALDDPIYQELDTLNGLGLLDTYISEVKPISRVEAARLTLEAEENLDDHVDRLGKVLIKSLRSEFSDEIGWLEKNHEDDPPTQIHPLERIEGQYIYSSGTHRHWALGGSNPWFFQGQEGTPLLPNNDGLPTSRGSNQILRVSNWAGVGGFLTAYGEGSIAGPITRTPIGINSTTTNRLRLLRGEVVAGLGNAALSFGYQEMAWGTGYFGSLSQSNNARPFPALRLQNIHPGYLPGFLRYLGPFRGQMFFGELDYARVYDPSVPKEISSVSGNPCSSGPECVANPKFLPGFSYPWLSGQIISFKPLPTFELGLDHAIMFGGRFNDNYSWLGFLGRATGLSTGSPGKGPTQANTKSRGGVFLKLYFPSLRNIEVYQEMLGNDNLTTEVRPIGGVLPFLSVSYQGGIYLPRLTADGLTDLRFEYALMEPNYSRHTDSLHWTNYSLFMGDPMGPDSTEVDLMVGRWLDYRYKADIDLFYTERAPRFLAEYYFDQPGKSGPEFIPLSKERSFGFAVDFLQIPVTRQITGGMLSSLKLRGAMEYVNNPNWVHDTETIRSLVSVSGSLMPARSWIWR